MSREFTIVMYHYVRDVEGSTYPGIKGLSRSKFGRQLQYLRSNFEVWGLDQIIACRSAGESLPRNICTLTFDDGYREHFNNVMPLLEDLNLKASFYPVGSVLRNRCVLDVNKIHFAIANETQVPKILATVDDTVREHMGASKLEELRGLYLQPNRFDPKEINFIKRLLQKALPQPLRSNLTDEIFRKFVTNDESAFADDLYLSMDNVNSMISRGMLFGSHTWSHQWLAELPPDDAKMELETSANFWRDILPSSAPLGICYPYGSHNEAVIELAKAAGFVYGLSTVPTKAHIDQNMSFARLDTNDFPQ